jgi:ADP-ribosylglycohydrolase
MTDGLEERLASLPDSYDALHDFAHVLADLPIRQDWPYVEPDDLPGIWAECDPGRPLGAVAEVDLADAARRVEAAFLGSVVGCVLGKPLEVNPTLAELRRALEATGDWPLCDYIREETLAALGRRHGSWTETVRGRIAYVSPDDDINYTILGMVMLEQHGAGLTKLHIKDAWLGHLPVSTTFGPERLMLARAALGSMGRTTEADLDAWVRVCNPKDEYCGALIRADAYGYACPGRPAFAAELAWRDASWTHRRTGTYATMFIAAAIACAQVMTDRLGIFETALQFVPRRSRFHYIASDSLEQVRLASDWLDGYARIHGKYGQYTHCQVYQEVGTLINTLRFAEDVGDGVCKQVSQGNDTDSFGATAGSLLGAYFGPGHLDDRWLAPFNDDLHTAIAWFFERSLSKLAKRMGELPARIAAGIALHTQAGERDSTTGL